MAENHNSRHGSSGYEKSDVNITKILVVAVAIVVFIAVFLIWLRSYFVLTSEVETYQTVLSPQSTTLRELRAHEDEVLNSYKLLDPAKGIYQIPINRAMEVMADEAFATKAGK